jgi:hypothetical protein
MAIASFAPAAPARLSGSTGTGSSGSVEGDAYVGEIVAALDAAGVLDCQPAPNGTPVAGQFERLAIDRGRAF